MESNAESESLVTAAKQGDQYAWEQLLFPLYPRLRSYIGRRVDHDNVEDLVNETMTRSVAGIQRFTWGPAGFDGWVFGIARKVTADHYRRSDREHRHLRSSQMLFEGVEDAPDEEILRADDYSQIRECFARLDASEREILELRIVGGLSAEQVAAVLGKRPGAVRTAQSRALAHLRTLMEYVDA